MYTQRVYFIQCDINRYVYEPYYNFSFLITKYIVWYYLRFMWYFSIYKNTLHLSLPFCANSLNQSHTPLSFRLSVCRSVWIVLSSTVAWFKANVHDTIINHSGAKHIYEQHRHHRAAAPSTSSIHLQFYIELREQYKTRYAYKVMLCVQSCMM